MSSGVVTQIVKLVSSRTYLKESVAQDVDQVNYKHNRSKYILCQRLGCSIRHYCYRYASEQQTNIKELNHKYEAPFLRGGYFVRIVIGKDSKYLNDTIMFIFIDN